MGIFKKDKNYVEIETKVKPIPYKTVGYEDRSLMFCDYPTTEREWQVLTGMFMLMLTAALADCIDPNMISAHGDAQLKQNYLDVFALGERFGVIERNEESEDNQVGKSSLSQADGTA